jgi:hypothetical protein
MSPRLLLHERTLSDGALETTWLEVEGGTLFFHVEGVVKQEIPLAILDGVMRRYGRPLADDVAIDGPRLVAGGRSLSVLRYRPRYDVIARDYLVYAKGDETPTAELATAVTGALAYLLGLRSGQAGPSAASTELPPSRVFHDQGDADRKG